MSIEISRTLRNWSTQHRPLLLLKNECILTRQKKTASFKK